MPDRREEDPRLTAVHNAIFGDPLNREVPGMLENVRAMRSAFDAKSDILMFYVRAAIGISVLALAVNNPITSHYINSWLH